MTTFTIVIPGIAVGKGRPRFARATGRPYTPAKTENAEAHMRACALQDVGQIMLEGPIAVSMLVTVPIPASWSKKKTFDALIGRVRPTGRPDADNLFKMVDSLNGICWRDDSQIVEAAVRKVYGEVPRTVLVIRDAATLAGEQARAA